MSSFFIVPPDISKADKPQGFGDRVPDSRYTEGNGYIVSWCVGHLVGLKFPNDYGNDWEQRFRHKVYIKNVELTKLI